MRYIGFALMLALFCVTNAENLAYMGQDDLKKVRNNCGGVYGVKSSYICPIIHVPECHLVVNNIGCCVEHKIHPHCISVNEHDDIDDFEYDDGEQ